LPNCKENRELQTIGKAKDVADVDTWEMLNLLVKNDLYSDCSVVDLEQDLITLKKH